MTLATNWVDNIGMYVNAAYLNELDGDVNANTATIAALFSGAATASVTTTETTTSSTYTDLATTTDQVTVPIGASGKAVVFIASNVYNASNPSGVWFSFAASGANTLAASDANAVGSNNFLNSAGPVGGRFGLPILVTGLSPGSTTFKMKYRAQGGTAQFANRNIAVIPLP